MNFKKVLTILILGFLFSLLIFSCSENNSPLSAEIEDGEDQQTTLARNPNLCLEVRTSWFSLQNVLMGTSIIGPWKRTNKVYFKVYENGSYKGMILMGSNIDNGDIVQWSDPYKYLYTSAPNGGDVTNFKLVVVEICEEWAWAFFSGWSLTSSYPRNNLSTCTVANAWYPGNNGVYYFQPGGGQIYLKFTLTTEEP